MKLEEIVTKFKEAGFSGRVYRNLEDARKAMDARAEEPRPTLYCPYKGEYRPIPPEVCEWHKEQQDPECSSCRPLVPRGAVMKNASVTWDPADLAPGEYVPDGRGGWKLKRRRWR